MGGFGGRTSLLRLVGLTAVAAAAFLALTAGSASASTHVFSTSFAGSGTNALTEPTATAVDNSAGPSAGDVYVNDPTNHRVEKFNAAGNFILMFGKGVNAGTGNPDVCTNAGAPTDICQPGTSASTPGAFETPAFLAVDGSTSTSAGDLYVADTADDLVTKFAPDGSVVSGWGEGGQLAGSSATGTGNLEAGSTLIESLTTETGAFSVGQEISAPGIPAATTITAVNPGSLEISEAASATETAALSAHQSFGSIGGIALDPGGNLVLLNESSRFFKFAPDGSFTGNFETGFGVTPVGIAINSLGDIYLVRGGSGPVAEITSTGAEISEEIDPGPPTGLAVDPSDDDLYVDGGTEVRRYDAAGNFLEAFGSGHLTAGAGLSVDSTSGIYAADTPAGHVAVFALFGPFAVTAPATAVTGTEATLHGRVGPTGAGNVTACSFEYVDAEDFLASGFASAESAPCSPAPPYAASTEVSAGLTGLNGGTTYRFRLSATDANATNVSAASSFTTLGPSVDSTSVSEVTATTAELETEVNPHGLATTYSFQYGTTTAYGSETPMPPAPLGEGTADVARSAAISGLEPSTTYHFRVLATNALGTSEGADRIFTTQPASASTVLPDNRGYELVSPPLKQGSPLGAISREGGLIQAAADGSAITYFAFGSIVPEPAGSRSAINSQNLATRTTSGWTTADITTPNQNPVGDTPGLLSEYTLFSADLSLAAVAPFGATPLSPATSERTPYLRTDFVPAGFCTESCYRPLVTACPAAGECPPAIAALANVPTGTQFGGVEFQPEGFEHGVEFITATPDLSHLLLYSPTPLAEGFAPEGIYEWSAGALTPVSFTPPPGETLCGASAPACVANGGFVGNGSVQVRNAISADGSRVFFSVNGKLFLRDIPREETLLLDAPQEGSGQAGHATFQLASADGHRVFFTDTERLTPGSAAAPGRSDLYMCEVPLGESLACALRDLTANAHNSTGQPADLQGGVIGAAEDGSSVYFVANGALTEGEGAVTGDCGGGAQPASNQCNLYRYDLASETIHLVAVLSGADFPDWAAASAGTNLGELTARVSPSGHYLAFMSERPLTGYDNRDAGSGEPDEEVLLYDAQAEGGEGKLLCASCNPSGARPRGARLEKPFPGPLVDGPQLWEGRWVAANVPGWTRVRLGGALYQSRYLSDSGRLFFNAADALAPSDTNGTEDVYQLEPAGVGDCTETSSTFSATNGGCVSLISAGTSSEESTFMDASETGNDVFFLTGSRLTAKDEDGAIDLYDARVGGGEAPPVKPVECSGDACQQPAVPPNDATPGSLTFNGAGNLLQCPKGKVKRHGKCVKKHKAKKHHKKKSPKKHQKSKQANTNRGGAK